MFIEQKIALAFLKSLYLNLDNPCFNLEGTQLDLEGVKLALMSVQFGLKSVISVFVCSAHSLYYLSSRRSSSCSSGRKLSVLLYSVS